MTRHPIFHAPPILWHGMSEPMVPVYRDCIEYDDVLSEEVYQEIQIRLRVLLQGGYKPDTLVIDADRFKLLVGHRIHHLGQNHYSYNGMFDEMLESFIDMKVVIVQGDFLQVLPSNRATLSMDFIQKHKSKNH
ncbi:hypothetical protein IAQ67_29010 (plasmid) [Paenibacillus peoriae]|uniref:Uncharacterized protein n=1 Tax=Paenibacillus peoriae TaxID=59893 RepID=A0A7H0YH38_9BACL|nr:hypothetical protein [Paenibacillus peoriae]QNR70396.1 hypothetical protein IAQ67_29010 [Paenibacillus peoriae]